MLKQSGTLLGAVLVAAGAMVHGAITHRWGTPISSGSRAEALHALILDLPGFTAEEIPSEIEVKEKSRVTCRRYYSPAEGFGGVVSIITGPPGAVSTHTPDVCYPSSGYTTVVPPRRERIELPSGLTVTCYVAEFQKQTATRTERQRVRWAWAVPDQRSGWSAPQRPRWQYLREPELYKLYVVTSVPVPSRSSRADASAEKHTGEAADDLSADPPAARAFVLAALSQYTDRLFGR
jgi:hypothetical protein